MTIHYLVLYLFINITLIITIMTLDILFTTSLFYTTFDPLNKFIFEPMKSILPQFLGFSWKLFFFLDCLNANAPGESCTKLLHALLTYFQPVFHLYNLWKYFCIPLGLPKWNISWKWVKGAVMQFEKTRIIDRLRVSKISWKFCIPTIHNFSVIYPWNLLFS